jgi:hypothetical protein
MSILPDVKDEAVRLLEEAQKRDIFLRLMGGLAIKLHSPSASHRSLERKYPDIDFITTRRSAKQLPRFLEDMGYTPNKTFNTLSGDWRQLYYDGERNRQIDIFIGDFSMCHKLPLGQRLGVEPITIPLAELLLTKLQIVEINGKDIRDICAVLLDHEVGPSDEETINSTVIAALCARDWGLYTTVNRAFQRVLDFMDAFELSSQQKDTIRTRIKKIRQAMDEGPKSLAWKIRDKIGTRVRWYDLPQEGPRS